MVVVDQPTYIEPSFDIKGLQKMLADPNATRKEKLAGLLGLHNKFWDAPVVDLRRMLYRSGHGKDTLQMLPDMVKSCKDCNQWASSLSKPVVTLRLAEHFNWRVQTDLFFIIEKIYVVLFDDCIRYALAGRLQDKTPMEWLRVAFDIWIRYFGSMVILASDQEGAVISDLVGIACEKFDIQREFGGSYGHSSAPAAERRLSIIKLGALKLWSTVQRTGLNATQDMCVSESAMAANLLLSYGGASPACALTGTQPRELYGPDNHSLSASSGAIEKTPDAIEVSIRLRMHSKDCILQTICEDRYSRAENIRVQQYKPEDIAKLVDGAEIDIWREPDEKNEPGWRGPAELIRLYRSDGKGTIQCRGVPMMIPLRHMRPHIGFVWWLRSTQVTLATQNSEDASTAFQLLQAIDMTPFGQIITYGRVYSDEASSFVLVPPDLTSFPPVIWKLALAVANDVLSLDHFDGIQFGTQLKRTKAVALSLFGRLVVWNRNDYKNYSVTEVNPINAIHLDRQQTQWTNISFLMYFTYSRLGENAEQKVTPIPETTRDLDMSTIPWSPSPWTSYGGSWMDDDDADDSMNPDGPLPTTIIMDSPPAPPAPPTIPTPAAAPPAAPTHLLPPLPAPLAPPTLLPTQPPAVPPTIIPEVVTPARALVSAAPAEPIDDTISTLERSRSPRDSPCPVTPDRPPTTGAGTPIAPAAMTTGNKTKPNTPAPSQHDRSSSRLDETPSDADTVSPGPILPTVQQDDLERSRSRGEISAPLTPESASPIQTPTKSALRPREQVSDTKVSPSGRRVRFDPTDTGGASSSADHMQPPLSVAPVQQLLLPLIETPPPVQVESPTLEYSDQSGVADPNEQSTIEYPDGNEENADDTVEYDADGNPQLWCNTTAVWWTDARAECSVLPTEQLQDSCFEDHDSMYHATADAEQLLCWYHDHEQGRHP